MLGGLISVKEVRFQGPCRAMASRETDAVGFRVGYGISAFTGAKAVVVWRLLSSAASVNCDAAN